MTEGFLSDYKQRGARWGGASFDVPEFSDDEAVLETGCGNGKTLKSLPPKAVGIDISKEAVTLAGGNCVVGDVRNLPFKDEVFDAVMCFHVLGHLNFEDRIKSVNEMFRVLKKGGRIYFKAFSVQDFRFGKGKEVEKNSFLKGDGITTHYFEPEEVGALFSENELCAGAEVFCKSWDLRVKAVQYKREEVLGIFVKCEAALSVGGGVRSEEFC